MHDLIIQESIAKTFIGFSTIRETYIFPTKKGNIPVSLLRDNNGECLGHVQYIDGDFDIKTNNIKPLKGAYVQPMLWNICSTKEFIEKFSDKNTELKFIELSRGENLSKPKELKGSSKSFTTPHILNPKGTIKSSVQVFIRDNDVYLKIGDYFSPILKTPLEDLGTPLNYRVEKYFGKSIKNKFIYPDNFGDIIIKQQAWIKIENLLSFARNEESQSVTISCLMDKCKEALNEGEDFVCSPFGRMMEKIVEKIYSMRLFDYSGVSEKTIS